MTILLDEAIAKARELPPAEQDLAAEAVLAVVHRHEPPGRLTPEQVEEVRRIRSALADGRERLLTDDEAEDMWRRLGA